MAKYKIYVNEIINLKHEIDFETDDCLDVVDTELTKIEGQSIAFQDIQVLLHQRGYNINKIVTDDTGTIEVDIDELEAVE